MLVAYFRHCFRVVLPSADIFLLPNARHVMFTQHGHHHCHHQQCHCLPQRVLYRLCHHPYLAETPLPYCARMAVHPNLMIWIQRPQTETVDKVLPTTKGTAE